MTAMSRVWPAPMLALAALRALLAVDPDDEGHQPEADTGDEAPED